MDRTVLPAITLCLPFLRKRSPDGATKVTEIIDVRLCFCLDYSRYDAFDTRFHITDPLVCFSRK